MSEEAEEEIKKPIGSFILEQKDIYSIPTNTGAHYHYSDVCKLLKRYYQSKLNEVAYRSIINESDKRGKLIIDINIQTICQSSFRTGANWLLNKLKKG